MKRRSIILLTLLFFIAVGILIIFLTSQSLELTKEEIEYIQQKETISFVSQTRYPPFEFLAEDGARIGMCIELSQWIGSEFGFKTSFTDTSFVEAQKKVLSKEVDVLTSFFYSRERDVNFDFTVMMFEIPASIFINSNSVGIDNLQDLQGKTIAMQKGDFAEEFLHQEGIDYTIIYTNDFSEATDLVLDGKADALIGDEPIVLYHLHTVGLSHLIKITGKPLYFGQNSMATKDGNNYLVSILNKGIARAKQTGTLYRIEQKWLGTRSSSGESKYISYLIILTVLLLAILLFIWFWNRSLRIRVRNRTLQLSASEERYKGFVQDTPLLICRYIPGGEIIFINQAYCDYFNKTSDELLGTNFQSLVFESDREMVMAKISSLSFDLPTKSDDHRIVTSGGDVNWQRWTDRALFNKQRQIIAYQSIGEDITERKEREKEINKLSTAVEQSPSVIAITNLNGDLEYVNPYFTTITGYSRTEALGQNPRILKSGILPDKTFEELWGTISSGQQWHGEFLNRKKNGDLFWEAASVSPITNDIGEIINYLKVSIDITDRKQSEQDLKLLLNEKEILFKEVHHRVKNNLQVIISLLNLQMSGCDSQTVSLLEEITSRIQIFADIHNSLYINENVSNIDINQHIQQNFANLHRVYGERNGHITLKTDIDSFFLNLDEAIPVGLLLNELMTNSFKYAFTNGGIISISIHQKKGMGISEIIYSDDGKGFVDSGEGFGSNIISAMANQLGLSQIILSVGSTRYEFLNNTIPITKDLKKDKILFVEDELLIAMGRISELRSAGYLVDDKIITSGEDAVQIIKNATSPPSLIIMDISLKGPIDGISAAVEIQKLNSSIPFVFTSGYEDIKTRKRLDSIFHSSFIPKMSTSSDFIKIVSLALQKK